MTQKQIAEAIVNKFNDIANMLQKEEFAAIADPHEFIVYKNLENSMGTEIEGICPFCKQIVKLNFPKGTSVYSSNDMLPNGCPKCGQKPKQYVYMEKEVERKNFLTFYTTFQLEEVSEVFATYKFTYVSKLNMKTCDIERIVLSREIDSAIYWNGNKRIFYCLTPDGKLAVSKAKIQNRVYFSPGSYIEVENKKEFAGVSVFDKNYVYYDLLSQIEWVTEKQKTVLPAALSFDIKPIPLEELIPFRGNILKKDRLKGVYQLEVYCAHCKHVWTVTTSNFYADPVVCPNCNYHDRRYRYSYLDTHHFTSFSKNKLHFIETKDSIDVVYAKHSTSDAHSDVRITLHNAFRVSKKDGKISNYEYDARESKWVHAKRGTPKWGLDYEFVFDSPLKDIKLEKIINSPVFDKTLTDKFIRFYLSVVVQNPVFSEIADKNGLIAGIFNDLNGRPKLKLDIEATTLHEMLGMPKEPLDEYSSTDGSFDITFLQTLFAADKNVPIDAVRWYVSNCGNSIDSFERLLKHFSLSEIYAYMTKLKDEEYLDSEIALPLWEQYLFKCKEKGLDINDKEIRFPDNFLRSCNKAITNKDYLDSETKQKYAIITRRKSRYNGLFIKDTVIDVPSSLSELSSGIAELFHYSSLYDETLNFDKPEESNFICFIHKNNSSGPLVASFAVNADGEVVWFQKKFGELKHIPDKTISKFSWSSINNQLKKKPKK